jgi:hypothetical protein
MGKVAKTRTDNFVEYLNGIYKFTEMQSACSEEGQ